MTNVATADPKHIEQRKGATSAAGPENRHETDYRDWLRLPFLSPERWPDISVGQLWRSGSCGSAKKNWPWTPASSSFNARVNRIPVANLEKVKPKVDGMVTCEKLTKVDEPTSWCSNKRKPLSSRITKFTPYRRNCQDCQVRNTRPSLSLTH